MIEINRKSKLEELFKFSEEFSKKNAKTQEELATNLFKIFPEIKEIISIPLKTISEATNKLSGVMIQLSEAMKAFSKWERKLKALEPIADQKTKKIIKEMLTGNYDGSDCDTLEDFIEKVKEIENVVTKKTKKVKLKYNKEHGSMISSPLTEALTTNFKPEKVVKANKEIHCNSIENSAGILSMIQKDESIDPYDFKTSESEILNNYTTIGLSREELQIYLILVNLYLTNISKKNQALGKPLEVDVKFLHNEILGRQDHFREEHLAFYRGIFSRLSTMRLTYKSNKSSKKLFKKREFKNCEIDSNLIQISVTTYNNLREQTITITPTEYTLLELREIRQFNNFVPNEFFSLDFRKEYDNVLYFGICLMQMHRNNATSKIKNDEGKTITVKNKTCGWEMDFTNLINKALPHAKCIINGYTKEKYKKRYIQSNIEKPLIKAINIMIKNNYIINFKFEKEINYKNAFNENMIKIIFNYDIGKLIDIDKS